MTRGDSRQRRQLKRVLAPTRACASLAQLERLGEPDITVWGHVASCPRCQMEWTLLHAFEAAAPLADEEAKVSWVTARLARELAAPPRRRPRFWARFKLESFGVALACMLVVAALGAGLRQPSLAVPTVLSTLRSNELTIVEPAGDLDRRPARLSWKPVAGASSYSARLMEVDGVQVWSVETSGAAAQLPEAVAALLVPGKPLLWQVTARDSGGFALAESPLQRFRMRPR